MWKHLQPATDTNRSNSPQKVHNIQSLPKSRKEVFFFFLNRQNLHFNWCHDQHRLRGKAFEPSQDWEQQNKRGGSRKGVSLYRHVNGYWSDTEPRTTWTGTFFLSMSLVLLWVSSYPDGKTVKWRFCLDQNYSVWGNCHLRPDPLEGPFWGAWPPRWASCVVATSVSQRPSHRALQGKANDIWGCDPMMTTAQTQQK